MANIEDKSQVSSVPKEVKVISFFYYIIGFITLTFGVVFFISSGIKTYSYFLSFIRSMLFTLYLLIFNEVGVKYPNFISNNIILILVIVSFFIFLIGWGIWKRKKWARISAIIYSTFIILQFFYMFFLQFFHIEIIPIDRAGSIYLVVNPLTVIYFIINASMIYYLIFDKNLKHAFS